MVKVTISDHSQLGPRKVLPFPTANRITVKSTASGETMYLEVWHSNGGTIAVFNSWLYAEVVEDKETGEQED
jgi:hypothetical protein